MLVGVPKEIKDHEYRVGLIPSTLRELVSKGHRVLVETGAGHGAGIGDMITRLCQVLALNRGRKLW